MKIEDIRKALKSKSKKPKVTNADFVSTGSTLLNCALTGHPLRGFRKGAFYYFVGDSQSGKTFFCLTCLAEASINPSFNNYRFIYDNIEGGALMNIQKFFGTAVWERMEPANKKTNSETIEDFYFNLDDAVAKDQPFIYILDSMDALSSKAEMTKFKEVKNARRKNRVVSGSYGDGKAKVNSQYIRQFLKPLQDTGSILIIINQTRANFDPMSFDKKTHSGGTALGFYNNLEIWSSIKSRIKKTVKKIPLEIGTNVKLHVKKNRESGTRRIVTIPIYHSYGIDDIGSCVGFLMSTEHWKVKGNTIIAHEFDITATPKKLITLIEDNDLLKDLIDLVGDVWKEIESAGHLKRKPRYE